MKKQCLAAVGAASLAMTGAACDGSDGGAGATTIEPPPGIYFGTVTPEGATADDAVGLITSDGRAAFVDRSTIEAFVGDVSGDTISGTMFASSAVDATAKVASVSGDTIEGTYTSALGGGSFSLSGDAELYQRGADLTKLAGTWVDSAFTYGIGISTWVIESDGRVAMVWGSSCTASGRFAVINPKNNEYDLSLTVSNCPGANGTYTGFGVLSDTYYTDDTLSFVFSNGSVGGLFEPIQQSAAAGTP